MEFLALFYIRWSEILVFILFLVIHELKLADLIEQAVEHPDTGAPLSAPI